MDFNEFRELALILTCSFYTLTFYLFKTLRTFEFEFLESFLPDDKRGFEAINFA